MPNISPKTSEFEWRVWYGAICRCKYPSSTIWRFYGGRGISVCERWTGKDGYARFLEDMGRAPANHTLERIDPDGDYTPENCKWVEKRRQARNTRRTVRAPDGTPVVDLAEAAGLPYSTVIQRIRRLGWSLDKALSEPKTHNGPMPIPERPHSRRRG